MSLFEDDFDKDYNYLPQDGIVNYYGRVMPSADADAYFHRLLNGIEWENDQAIIFGKLIITKRKVAWYGDKEFDYTYSKITKKARLWTKELLELKTIAEAESGEQFNSCLLNLYHSGTEGMAWHSDGETALKKHGAIASFSFGAERKFSFKHKQSKETVSLNLEHGSLLIMKGQTQTNWLHRLPPTTKVNTPRINLTFRFIVE
jgi:alkylated DNA repair dioxygenase AlkB